MNDPNSPDQRVQWAEERTALATERTLLAAERTLSAWIRTGLAGVGGGLAVVQFLQFKDPLHKWSANIAGELLILWGIFIFIFAYINYRLFCRRLEKTTGYRPAQLAIESLFAILVIASIVFMFITIRRLHFLT